MPIKPKKKRKYKKIDFFSLAGIFKPKKSLDAVKSRGFIEKSYKRT